MDLTLEQGKEVLINTIQNDLRHIDYDRVTKLAKEYTAYVTGEDVESLLIQFSPRENTDAFKQRIELTQLITPYIAARVMTPMYKAGRTVASKNINWKDKKSQEKNKNKLSQAISKFHGEISVEDYLAYRLVELDSTDPNSFIVTEFEGEVNPADKNTQADPYPFEVNSKEAINYKYINNTLQYLVVRNEIKKLERYTIYLKDDAIVAQEILSDDLAAYKIKFANAEIIFKDDTKKESSKIYILTIANHKAGRVPAIRVGVKRDLTTRNRTCVPLIHAARSFFKKSIKTISEFDLTNTLHTFPQKITYDSICEGNMTENVLCNNGKTPSGETCGVCKGSGFNEHKSSQDIIRVKTPDSLKDVVSLENFIAYKYPPTEILKYMKELCLYEFPELAVKAVYTSELFAVDKITTTATEKNIDLESVYDALKPFTDQWSSIYKHIVLVSAAYLSVSSDIIVEHAFPKDFKMKSIDALLEDLTKANNSGVPSYIKKEIVKDITQKLYADKPNEILKINIKEKFYPFNGKTENEITVAITSGLVSNYNKFLYANYDLIFDELEQENSTNEVNFYKLEPNRQKELLKLKVQVFITEIENEQTSERANSFGNANNTATEIPDNTGGGA